MILKLNFKKIKIIIFCFLMLLISNFLFVDLIEAGLFDSGSDARGYLNLIGEHGYEETSTLGPDVSFQVAIYKIINIFLSFIGGIFVFLIIYGGFLWMTAAGNDEQVRKARTVIIRSFIGVFVVIASLAITRFVFISLIEATT